MYFNVKYLNKISLLKTKKQVFEDIGASSFSRPPKKEFSYFWRYFFYKTCHCGLEPVFIQRKLIGLEAMMAIFKIGSCSISLICICFSDVYYCIIIAWTLFYLLSTIINIPELPWRECGQYFYICRVAALSKILLLTNSMKV